MKYITAEGPSTEFSYLTRNGKLDVFIPRPTGHTYPAAHEPVQEWNLTEHVVCPVCGEKTMYERGHFPPSKVLCEHLQARPTKAQIKLLCDIRALPFEPIENGRQLLKLIMDYDKTVASLLNSAQRVLELYAKTGSASPLPARSVLADIRAMKGGK